MQEIRNVRVALLHNIVGITKPKTDKKRNLIRFLLYVTAMKKDLLVFLQFQDPVLGPDLVSAQDPVPVLVLVPVSLVS